MKANNLPSINEQIQGTIRSLTATAGQYNEDWHALFDLAGIAKGQLNERMLAYYNSFNTPVATVSAAMYGFALSPTAVGNGTVAGLFSAGQPGAWHEPSDFSTLFQDSAGTTPVTALEQVVGKVNDKSGRANHATPDAFICP